MASSGNAQVVPTTSGIPGRASRFPWTKFVVGGCLMTIGPVAWLLLYVLALGEKVRGLSLPSPDGNDPPPPETWQAWLSTLGPAIGIGFTVAGFVLVLLSLLEYERRKAAELRHDGPWR